MTNILKSILAFLAGKKTIICFALLFIVGGLHGLGLIDSQTFTTLSTILVGLGGISLRIAMM